uniref:Uncharacterized protein n=1 Tax=Populus trichocarpa TaxID=3694 RepID=A0A2K1WRN0_POPTR
MERGLLLQGLQRFAIHGAILRANPNIVLATPQHGGHLAFFEGLAATSYWWSRAVDEFLGVLHLVHTCMYRRKFLNHILQQKRISMWFLAFIAIRTNWPLLGSALNLIFRKQEVKKSHARSLTGLLKCSSITLFLLFS